MPVKKILLFISIVFSTLFLKTYACSFEVMCGGYGNSPCQSINDSNCGESGCAETEVCHATSLSGVPNPAVLTTYTATGSCVANEECKKKVDERYGTDCGARGQECCDGKVCLESSPYIQFGMTEYLSDVCYENVCYERGSNNLPIFLGNGDTLVKTIDLNTAQEVFIDISALLASTYKLLYPAAILIGFLFVIVAGYKYMSSEGDPQKVKEAQNDLSSAIAGMLFVLLAATILRIVINNILQGNLQI